MVRVWSTSKTAICTKDNTVRAGSMVLDNSSGITANTTRGISGMASGTGKGFGKEELVRMISTKVSSGIIRRMAMEFILGPAAISTRGIIRIICVVDTGKCTGRTAASTGGNGSWINKMEMAKDSMGHKPFKEDFS